MPGLCDTTLNLSVSNPRWVLIVVSKTSLKLCDNYKQTEQQPLATGYDYSNNTPIPIHPPSLTELHLTFPVILHTSHARVCYCRCFIAELALRQWSSHGSEAERPTSKATGRNMGAPSRLNGVHLTKCSWSVWRV